MICSFAFRYGTFTSGSSEIQVAQAPQAMQETPDIAPQDRPKTTLSGKQRIGPKRSGGRGQGRPRVEKPTDKVHEDTFHYHPYAQSVSS